MISFDFEYYKPQTAREAFDCFRCLTDAGKKALYFGGGTEILSMARADSIRFDAVIDIKGIPECSAITDENGALVIGSAVTLTEITESECFPLLGKTVSRIADHTIQEKITLGGNLGGTIIYREAALPLMITSCKARIMTAKGEKTLPFSEVFDGKLRLGEGELLLQILIDKSDIELPYNHVKKTKQDKIDYPLISLAANRKNGIIRAAASGAATTPLLLPEDILNDEAISHERRIDEIVSTLGDRLLTDITGSREYRKFVLGNILTQLYENFRGL